MNTPLAGHTSADTAYVVDDYPYGFTLRCKIKYWIETTKHGSRVVSATTNPKKPGNPWNKPKASTYSLIRVLYLNTDNGHVENAGLSYYDDSARIEAFEAEFGSALTDRDKKVIAVFKAANARREARKAEVA